MDGHSIEIRAGIHFFSKKTDIAEFLGINPKTLNERVKNGEQEVFWIPKGAKYLVINTLPDKSKTATKANKPQPLI